MLTVSFALASLVLGFTIFVLAGFCSAEDEAADNCLAKKVAGFIVLPTISNSDECRRNSLKGFGYQ